MSIPRRLHARLVYIALALGTIGLGLAVHWHGALLGSTTRDVLGDALWATMITWWVSALDPRAPVWRRSFAALGLCFAVEWSQLVHTPAIDALRGTSAGHLVLGSGFDARDFGSYTVGVVWAAVLERAATRRRGREATARAG